MKLRNILLSIVLTFMWALPVAASADTQALATCLTDSLNGKERKLLVKWVYFAMAAHPELEANSIITEADRDSSDKATGSLITRLFVQDCPKEAKLAQRSDPMAVQNAFEFVGQVAMQEIVTNQKVIAAIGSYIEYTDLNKINAILVE